MKILFSLLAITVLLGGCAANQGQKQTGGTLLGAGLGALVGSQVGGGKGKLAAVAIASTHRDLLPQESTSERDRRQNDPKGRSAPTLPAARTA